MANEDKNGAVVSADGEDLPSHTELLLTSGLYREYDLDGDFSYVRRMYVGPGIQFDSHCVYCQQTSTFKQFVEARGSGSGVSLLANEIWLEPRVILLEFHCQRTPRHTYHYMFRVERQAITKVGQSPSLATIASPETARFKRALKANYVRDLNMAIGLFAHGVGAGSFVYLRRIFEHLLFEAAGRARDAGDPLNDYKNMRMNEKIKRLASHLPAEVVETAETYSILSAGIHGLSEEQCLSLFPIMRQSIEIILDSHMAARERETRKLELKQALAKAERQIKADAQARKGTEGRG